jgi:hypothetical protein
VTADIHADLLFQGVNAEHNRHIEAPKKDTHDNKSPGKNERNSNKLATKECEIGRPTPLK